MAERGGDEARPGGLGAWIGNDDGALGGKDVDDGLFLEVALPSSSSCYTLLVRFHGRRRGRRFPAASSLLVRGRILQAARLEFGARGYAGATFEEISKRVGLSRPVVNYHFGDKELLYREVLAHTGARIAEDLRTTRRSPAETTLLAELTDLFAHVVALDASDALPGSTVAFVMSSVQDAHRQPQLGVPRYLGALKAQLTDLVHEAVQRGELPSNTDVAAVAALLAALLCAVGLTASSGDHTRVQVVVELLRDALAGTLWQIRLDPQNSD